MSIYDAVIIGSGPNGLAAAVEMAQKGQKVLVIEGAETIGGGTRTTELTLPGFYHDYCSAVHPLGVLSPFFRTLPLDDYGLKWIHPPASVAHPLDEEPAVLFYPDLQKTADNLGLDGPAWERMVRPFLQDPHALLNDILGPLRIPEKPVQLARFGLKAAFPADKLARWLFRESRTRALFAGMAAHSILPLDKWFTSAVGLVFAISGHTVAWPVVAGGSTKITQALANYLIDLGGNIQTGRYITAWKQLPPAKVYLFDTDPGQLADIAGPVLPASYLRRLEKFHYGPGIFKLDWALDGPIPWKDERCLEASTVHIGGTLPEIAASERAAWEGKHSEKPFVLLCQQSQFDPRRAPVGKHTGYAYCHVPYGSTRDMTEIIEDQVERFAPGFKDVILARHATNTLAFERYNPNYAGGVISGGSNELTQLFTRPVARLNPYTTPNPQVFICSASTPPGGGVHGMCGYHAARAALQILERK